MSAPDDGAVTVGDRILPRILLFSGLPVALGLLLLPGFWYLKVRAMSVPGGMTMPGGMTLPVTSVPGLTVPDVSSISVGRPVV